MISPQTIHVLKDIAAEVIVACSVAHSVLPPWDAEAFKPYPRFVKFYKVFVYLVGYVAINMRSTIYRSISTQTNGGVNESINHASTPPDPQKPQS